MLKTEVECEVKDAQPTLSHVRLFATPWTSPGDLPKPGIEHRSPELQVDSLPAESQGSLKKCVWVCVFIYIYIYIYIYMVKIMEDGTYKGQNSFDKSCKKLIYLNKYIYIYLYIYFNIFKYIYIYKNLTVRSLLNQKDEG